MNCEVCAYNNPRGTATLVVIQDGHLLLVKRNIAPHKGMWDMPGGYMDEGERPEETAKRELEEELGVTCKQLVFIDWFPGTTPYENKEGNSAILNHAYLAEVEGDISLDQENSDFQWVPIPEIDPEDIAFDSNQDIIRFVKTQFDFDLARVRELTSQLDNSAVVDECSLYRATLNGYVSKIVKGGKLLGMGWIFPRQTLLRRQAVIEDMIVDETHRGKGFGKAILDDLIRWAKDNDMATIELTSSPKRVAANALYKKAGFVLHETNHYLMHL